FWFHPLVWWVGARLTEERERACDEEVIRLGGHPQTYAESILKVCEFYLSSPVPCAAGVTGGELKTRIEGIVSHRFTRDLSFAKKALLALSASLAVAVPAIIGIVRAQTVPDSPHLSFDVASVKQDHSGIVGGAGDWVPGTHGPGNGRYHWTRINILRMIGDAYDVKWDQVEGVPKTFQGPEMAFNIDAKFPPETTTAQFRLMLQSLLADRFHFSMHRETRELPAIALEVAKGGLKLKPASGDCLQHPAKAPPDEYRCGVLVVLLHSGADFAWEYTGRSVSMANIAEGFMQDAPVVDNTGLGGLYDIDVKVPFQPHASSNDPVEQLNNELDFDAGFKAAFEKQAGLSVNLGARKKLPVPVIVVDHLEMPTPN
ncbi:MAG TPA: M56 family metallopeptidase, partial [Bryobacteraceae bacterium]|nr:M56 family metallopeptidase [Bryobacteraceae bacterium]